MGQSIFECVFSIRTRSAQSIMASGLPTAMQKQLMSRLRRRMIEIMRERQVVDVH